MRDTSPEVDAMYTEMLLSLPPGRRVQMGLEMLEFGMTMALAGIRMECGGQDEVTERLMLFERLYREDFSDEEMKKVLSALRVHHEARQGVQGRPDLAPEAQPSKETRDSAIEED